MADFEDGLDQGYEEVIMCFLKGFQDLPREMKEKCRKSIHKWADYYLWENKL